MRSNSFGRIPILKICGIYYYFTLMKLCEAHLMKHTLDQVKQNIILMPYNTILLGRICNGNLALNFISGKTMIKI